MVVFGGFGVLVVLAFVAGLALADRSAEPGDRVAVVRAGEGIEVLADRCGDERVTMVAVLGPDGEPLWRIRSRKGGIERRYGVGAPPPLGFVVEVPFAGSLPGTARAEVELDGESTDARPFRVDDLEEASGEPGCGSRPDDLRGTTLLFSAGALGVVATYGLMVSRWWRGRRPRPRR